MRRAFVLFLLLSIWTCYTAGANQVRALWENPNSVSLAGVYLYYGRTSQAGQARPAGDGAGPYELRQRVAGENPTEATVTLPTLGTYYFRATAFVLDEAGQEVESAFSNEAVFENELRAPLNLRIEFSGTLDVQIHSITQGN